MQKEDIRIKRVIVHIMDSLAGMPVLSDTEIEFGSDFAEFLKEHIYKVMSSDDCKQCRFYEKESEVYQMLVQYNEENFIPMSRDMADYLYQIMNSNIDIPPADLVVVRFKADSKEYMGILKMDYKESYTHRTRPIGEGSHNEIVKYRSILPTEGQQLSEAAIIDLEDLSVRAIEKKYTIYGEKTNYFTYLFLKCNSEPSQKTKLSIVAKAVENVQNKYFDEDTLYEKTMRAKDIIHEALKENGGFLVEEIAERIFEGEPELKIEFQDQMERYDMVKQEIAPQSERTTKKYEAQSLTTDSGIEIMIPMDQYKDTGRVEFITNQNGSISVLIKNISHIRAKF